MSTILTAKNKMIKSENEIIKGAHTAHLSWCWVTIWLNFISLNNRHPFLWNICSVTWHCVTHACRGRPRDRNPAKCCKFGWWTSEEKSNRHSEANYSFRTQYQDRIPWPCILHEYTDICLLRLTFYKPQVNKQFSQIILI